MDLADQGAGGIDDLQAALLRRDFDFRRYSVGAIHQPSARRHVIEIVDEHDAAAAKTLNNVPVVHNFVIHKQRRSEPLQRQFQRGDGHVHAGAKPARSSQDDLHAGTSKCCYGETLARPWSGTAEIRGWGAARCDSKDWASASSLRTREKWSAISRKAATITGSK